MKANETKKTTNVPGSLPSLPAAAGARWRLERRLAAALALDVVGYSLLIGNDDEGTHHRVGKVLARVNKQVSRFEGNIVSFSGDGLMAVFPSSRAALRCGISIQKELRQGNRKAGPQQRIIFRVGIHAGELVFQGSRVGGDPLNIAARLEQICPPGEICISAALLEQAEQTRGISIRSIGTRKLKNIRQPVRAYRVSLENSDQEIPGEVTTIVHRGAREVWSDRPSIAVLPLGYVGGDAGDAYFAEDVVDGITALLTDLNRFVVVSRPSRVAHGGLRLDIRELSHNLGVRYVLSGSVRRSTTTVRVAAELYDAEELSTIWADTTEVLLGERFDWQDQIAQRIVADIVPYICDEEVRCALRRRSSKLDVSRHSNGTSRTMIIEHEGEPRRRTRQIEALPTPLEEKIR